jgi:hypothetical protein
MRNLALGATNLCNSPAVFCHIQRERRKHRVHLGVCYPDVATSQEARRNEKPLKSLILSQSISVYLRCAGIIVD